MAHSRRPPALQNVEAEEFREEDSADWDPDALQVSYQLALDAVVENGCTDSPPPSSRGLGPSPSRTESSHGCRQHPLATARPLFVACMIVACMIVMGRKPNVLNDIGAILARLFSNASLNIFYHQRRKADRCTASCYAVLQRG